MAENTVNVKNEFSDYPSLLARVRSKLPKSTETHERFVLPELDVLYEGKTTVFRNFGDVVDKIRRDPTTVMAYLLRELGTAGDVDGKRLIFRGRVATKALEDRINSFVATYVICSECHRPDTKIIKDGRTSILVCEACGAHRPVTVHKTLKKEEPLSTLKEGSVYEVMIEDVSKRGDGIARRDKYIIYVPGTTKGNIVKVLIEKISGNTAFAKVQRDTPA
ncbi:MAG: translation initiation factor IF-2 subunit beta [Thermoplasmata archaeon]